MSFETTRIYEIILFIYLILWIELGVWWCTSWEAHHVCIAYYSHEWHPKYIEISKEFLTRSYHKYVLLSIAISCTNALGCYNIYIICHGICNELHFLSINNVVIALYPFWKGNTYFLYYTFLLIIVIEQSSCSELNFQIGIFTLHDRKRVNIKEMKRENINGSKQILFTYSLTYFWKWNTERQEILFFDSFYILL